MSSLKKKSDILVIESLTPDKNITLTLEKLEDNNLALKKSLSSNRKQIDNVKNLLKDI